MKHAVIVGAGDSVGLSVARKLSEQEVFLHLLEKKEEKAKELESEFTENASVYICDATKNEELENVFEKISSQTSEIHYLLNTISKNPFKSIDIISYEEMVETLTTTLISYMNATRLASPLLAHKASVVNISSVHGFNTRKNFSTYAAGKGGVHAFTRGAALDLREKMVRVNTVVPGGFADTNYMRENQNWKEKIEKDQISTLEEIRDVVLFLLSSQSSSINAETIICDKGVHAQRFSSDLF